jgi:hypothetical protein
VGIETTTNHIRTNCGGEVGAEAREKDQNTTDEADRRGSEREEGKHADDRAGRVFIVFYFQRQKDLLSDNI